MKRILLTALATLSLAACSHFDTGSKRITASCASATAAVNIINDNFDKLSDKAISRVSYALDVVTPICGQGEKPTVDKAKKVLLDTAVQTLLQVKEQI